MATTFYTIDVGHGLCQVIRFGDRAILIDGGGRIGKRIAEDFLKRYVKVIEVYIATHNDVDHVRAAPELLDHYSSAATLRNAYMLIDRPARRREQMEEDVIPLLGYLKRRASEKTIGNFDALHMSGLKQRRARCIYRNTPQNIELQLIYPKWLDTTESFLRGEPDPVATNQASAILRFVTDRNRRASVLITGDANCESFRVAHDEYRFDLSARVLAVPHHGGEIPVPTGAPDWATIVDWVNPEIAVVSAGFGTVPQSTTTRRATFDPLRQRNVNICCTQITKHCHPSFASLHPSVMPSSNRPLPQMSGHRDFPHAIGCAGTIAIKISSDGAVTLWRREDHHNAVTSVVVPNGCPHCR